MLEYDIIVTVFKHRSQYYVRFLNNIWTTYFHIYLLNHNTSVFLQDSFSVKKNPKRLVSHYIGRPTKIIHMHQIQFNFIPG